jgi:hypothetical protein
MTWAPRLDRLRRVWNCAAWVLTLSACTAPQLPADNVSEVARDTNLAARFGKLDEAASHTVPAAREHFLKHRAQWGEAIRVFDTELARLTLVTPERADVWITVVWGRPDEARIRTTEVHQRWENPGGGWKWIDESRASGDVGLLGERVVVLEPPPTAERFPTRVIR